MGKVEDALEKAVADGDLPQGVVFATNASGSFTYKHAAGRTVLGKQDPIPENAIFLQASCTKLLTSIAALQIVERGLFGLDDDVTSVIHEIAKQPIFKGFDDKDEPIYETRKNPITLRTLLTHSSGLVYDALSPDLTKLAERRGHATNTGATVAGRFCDPLLFEPGTRWLYSPGLDWAGRLVERLTKQTLEQCFQKHIFEPVGVTEATFFPYEDSRFKDRVPHLTTRTAEGGLALYTDPWINTGSTDCFGGHGLYAPMGDYLRVQQSILANDGKLLKPSSVETMFTPQLSPEAKESFQAFISGPFGAMLPGEQDPQIEVDWGIGGMLFLQDDRGRRKKGTLHWAGMANTFWTIDREADLALTFGTQVLPPGDAQVAKVITAVELGVYEMHSR